MALWPFTRAVRTPDTTKSSIQERWLAKRGFHWCNAEGTQQQRRSRGWKEKGFTATFPLLANLLPKNIMQTPHFSNIFSSFS